jgi:hypothetical protein
MAQTPKTTVASITLDDLNTVVLRQEEIGYQLVSIEGKTVNGTKFNQLIFEDKIPNNGPYSKVFQTPPEPNLNGKTLVYQGLAFIANNSVHITVLR